MNARQHFRVMLTWRNVDTGEAVTRRVSAPGAPVHVEDVCLFVDVARKALVETDSRASSPSWRYSFDLHFASLLTAGPSGKVAVTA